jgi:hypothetical protein
MRNTQKFCLSCGHEIGEKAAFCNMCGARQAFSGVLVEAAAVAAAAESATSPATAPTISEELPNTRPLVETTAPLRTAPPASISTGQRTAGPTLPLLFVYIAAGVIVVLVAVIVAGSLYARSLIDQRDTALAVAQGHLADLTAANIAFQDQLKELSSTRDQLVSDLAVRTGERDTARTAGDSLRQQLQAAQTRATGLEVSLSDATGQVAQARRDSSSQQQRANNADSRSTAVAAVLALDDQIYTEFYNFLNEVNTMATASQRSDTRGASAAYARAKVVSDRLDRLFTQRKAALAKI